MNIEKMQQEYTDQPIKSVDNFKWGEEGKDLMANEWTHTQRLSFISAVVTRYREELEDLWPTPNTKDCLLYAFTEIAEVVDAELRLNQEHVRNNHKEIDPLDEAADCLFMLISAILDCRYEPPRIYDYIPEEWYISAARNIVDAIDEYNKNNEWQSYAFKAITLCLEALGEQAEGKVIERLQRIKNKAMIT